MSFKGKLGKTPNLKKFNGKTYTMLDPTEFLLNLFTFRHENDSFFPTDHWELTIILIIGTMAAGKTETMKNIAMLGHSIYQENFHCFQTNDLIYSLKYLNEDIDSRKKVEFIFFDDALTGGLDSRQSMTSDNIEMSQNLSIVRHLLANEDENKRPDPRVKNGFCTLVYAIQSPTRLDKFIRENAHLIIYKSYYDNLETEKSVPDSAIDFLKDVTEDSMYKHTYAARGSGLGRTKTKKTMQMYFPRVQFDIPVILPPPEKYQELLNALLKFNLDEVKDGVLKGFIANWCDEHNLTLGTTGMVQLIYKAKYYQFRGIEELNAENPKPKIDYRDILIQNEILGMKWDDLARKYDIARTTLYDNCMRYKAMLLNQSQEC